MRLHAISLLAFSFAAVTLGGIAGAQTFNRVATLPNYVNNGDLSEETVSEIIAASADTSDSFIAPSGHLAVVNIATNPASLVTTIDLGGQPDSVAISPDGLYAAIAIENERDDDRELKGNIASLFE